MHDELEGLYHAIYNQGPAFLLTVNDYGVNRNCRQ